jgi:hypothetical protein
MRILERGGHVIDQLAVHRVEAAGAVEGDRAYAVGGEVGQDGCVLKLLDTSRI